MTLVAEPSGDPAAAARVLDGVTIAYCVDEVEARQLLAQVIRDAGDGPLAIDLETAPNQEEIDRLNELRGERARVAGRLDGARKVKAPAKEIAALKAESKALLARIKYASTAAVDPRRSRVRLLQTHGGGRCVAVIDLDRTGAGVLGLLDGMTVVAHAAAFELAFLEQAGVEPAEVHCTLQASRLTLGENATSLAAAAAAYLGVTLDKEPQTSDWSAPHLSRRQLDYAAADAVICWRLAQRVLPGLGAQASAYEIQMAAVPAAMRMERLGFRFDVDAHANLMDNLARERVDSVEAYIRACAESGHGDLARAPPPSTPKQKIDLLQRLLTSNELARWKRTQKAGTLSTRRSELLRAAHYPPIAALVALSSIDKLMTTFGPTLAAFVSPVTGRIHAHYRVAATASGRASCSGPNMQQIPRDPRFRALFKPEPGSVLIVADYSSMELRAAAHISGDAAMTAAFEEGLDIHRITAARMADKTPEEVTAEERRAAKAVNFGACYGLGARGLVETAWTGYGVIITEREAAGWLEAFEAAYPRFARWRREHAEQCERRGRIVIGRDAAKGVGRFYPLSRLPSGASAYTRACNLPVQGCCADASMLALAAIDRLLFEEGIEGGPVAWLHDEIVIETAAEQKDRAAELLHQAMIEAFVGIFPGAPVTGLVEPRIGMSWGEAKP